MYHDNSELLSQVLSQYDLEQLPQLHSQIQQ